MLNNSLISLWLFYILASGIPFPISGNGTAISINRAKNICSNPYSSPQSFMIQNTQLPLRFLLSKNSTRTSIHSLPPSLYELQGPRTMLCNFRPDHFPKMALKIPTCFHWWRGGSLALVTLLTPETIAFPKMRLHRTWSWVYSWTQWV